MDDLLVVYRHPETYRTGVSVPRQAERVTKENLAIDEEARTWRFTDRKLARFGSFPFGGGPSREEEHKYDTYPHTQSVFKRLNNTQIAEMIDHLRSKSFGSGHKSGGAIDAD